MPLGSRVKGETELEELGGLQEEAGVEEATPRPLPAWLLEAHGKRLISQKPGREPAGPPGTVRACSPPDPAPPPPATRAREKATQIAVPTDPVSLELPRAVGGPRGLFGQQPEPRDRVIYLRRTSPS